MLISVMGDTTEGVVLYTRREAGNYSASDHLADMHRLEFAAAGLSRLGQLD